MKNYSEYFPAGKIHDSWGVRCTAIGHCRTQPGQPYPLRVPPHPVDHDFTWKYGRILQDLQIVYISAGAGELEYRKSGVQRIEAGTLFFVLPGTWHRYRPDNISGWTEHWLELSGVAVEKILHQHKSLLHEPVFSTQDIPEISEMFFKSHCLVNTHAWAYEQQIGLAGLEILLLALRSLSSIRGERESQTEREVKKLQQKLLDAGDESIKLRDLLKDSSLSHVHLRRLFKRRTGLSPKQYLLQIRLRHAMNLLRQTRMTLADIAERLGYDSAYHLSQDFKNRVGVSPAPWRKSAWRLHQK